MEPHDRGLEVPIGSGLAARIRRYADAEGVPLGEAAEAVLLLGLEFAEEHQVRVRDELVALQRDVRDLKDMVDLVGPAAFGVLRLLAHWAAQTGGLKVSEDELLAEGRLVAEDEWQGQLAERGLLSSPPSRDGG